MGNVVDAEYDLSTGHYSQVNQPRASECISNVANNDETSKTSLDALGTIGGAWAPTITTNVVNRIIDAVAFREDLKEKAKTIQSPNNDEYRRMVDEESPMGGGFIPPTEEELKGGFDDGGILYNGKDR